MKPPFPLDAGRKTQVVLERAIAAKPIAPMISSAMEEGSGTEYR